MKTVHTLTLGAGGGAYPAAFALARAGHQVVMADTKGVMSGNCLAEGCVPSKAVREVAELRRRSIAGASRIGLDPVLLGANRAGGGSVVDYKAVLEHKDHVQQTRYRQHDAELAELSDHLQLLGGTARIIDPHTVEIDGPSGKELFRADHLIVATGSDVLVPKIPGAELCVTSHDIFKLGASVTSLPHRLAVIGGGYIGLEVACMFHALGSEVTILEALDELLSGMDPDFTSLLVAGLDPGIKVELGAKVSAIQSSRDGFKVSYEHNGAASYLDADQVLMAVGRQPVIPQGAAEIGLTLEGHGLGVQPTMQTALSHIYAPGDVNGRSMLFHSAVRQSLVAAHNILAGDRAVDRMDFNSVPTTIFTSPEGSYVGLTRASAKKNAISVVESAYPLEVDSRAQILDETYGEIRLFFEEHSLRLVGGWVVGIDAAQLVGEIGIAVAMGMSAYEMARFADQHPMAAEGISRAARAVAG
ncbi:MAG: dihydrolipoyl dehydrogenase [Actinobacteria bacterium]|nr:dihydrolipoyl dehydrogenase [Actinomycetota bacterium]